MYIPFFKRISALFTVFLLALFMVFPAYADAPESDDDSSAVLGVSGNDAATSGTTGGESQNKNVFTFEEFKEWLDENNDSGKTVTFGAIITIPGDEAYLPIWNITIDTANHCLIIESKSVRFWDGVKVTGEGTALPVITIKKNGRLDIMANSEVTATGTGANGCAVKIESGGAFDVWDSCAVLSEGANAVGIYAEDGLALSCTSIISGGIGVMAGGDVELFMCHIDAPVPVHTSGTVSHESCDIAGETDITMSRITGICEGGERNLKSLYHMMALGDSIPPHRFDDSLQVILDDDRELWLPVSWDTSAIDTSAAGTYEAVATILAPYDRFRLDDGFPLTMKVEVADASTPVFCGIYSLRQNYNTLEFLYTSADLSGLTLWRSDDEGENWYDYTQDAEMFFNETLMLVLRETVDSPILFVFEAGGLGESQIVRVALDENTVYASHGGDRIGTDRRPAGDGIPPDRGDTPDDTNGETPENDTSGNTGDSEQNSRNKPREWKNDNELVISGERISVMIDANPEDVPLVVGGVQLTIPTESLKELDLENGRLFSAKIETHDDNTRSVIIKVDDEDISGLPVRLMESSKAETESAPADSSDNKHSGSPLGAAAIPMVLSGGAVIAVIALSKLFLKGRFIYGK